MQMEHPTRLELLVRQNKGRMEHQYYATELSHLLKAQIAPSDIFDLAESDRLLSSHRRQSVRSNNERDFAFRKTWNFQPIGPWSSTCCSLGRKLQGEPTVLFVGPYEFCGAIKVRADRALSAAAPLLNFDKDTVSLQSLATDSGLYLDLFEEGPQRFVELVVWGQWKSLAKHEFLKANNNEHC
ncbi:MAG: hypothetical protein WBS24_10290 [Terriglobales bacterium]